MIEISWTLSDGQRQYLEKAWLIHDEAIVLTQTAMDAVVVAQTALNQAVAAERLAQNAITTILADYKT